MGDISKKESKYLFNEKKPFCVMERTLTTYQSFHWHDFYEIEYIIEGDGDYAINGISHQITANTLFFSTPSDFHEIIFNHPTKLIKIQFLPEFMNTNFLNHITEPIILKDSKKMFLTFFDYICKYSSRNDKFSTQFIKDMLNSLLFLIMSSSDKCIGEKAYTTNRHFQQALKYINNHFTEPMSLQDIAKQVNVSPVYLSSLFKKHSGQKISDYITSLRLNHAYNLIKNTNIPINEVFYLCGYNSYPHFIRAFKAKYEDSPNHLRKTLHQKEFEK